MIDKQKLVDEVLCGICSINRDKGCPNCQGTCIYLKKAKLKLSEMVKGAIKKCNGCEYEEKYIAVSVLNKNFQEFGLLKVGGK